MKSYSKISLLCILIVSLCPISFAMPPGYQAKGTITLNGNTIELKSAVATWRSELNALMIDLLPVELDSEEIKLIQDSSVEMWMMMNSHQNSEPGDSLRRGVLIIYFKGVNKELAISNVSRYGIGMYGPGTEAKDNLTIYLSVTDKDGKFHRMSGSAEDGTQIEITFEGDTTLQEHIMNWNFELDSVVAE